MCYLVHKVPGGNSGPESAVRSALVYVMVRNRSLVLSVPMVGNHGSSDAMYIPSL